MLNVEDLTLLIKLGATFGPEKNGQLREVVCKGEFTVLCDDNILPFIKINQLHLLLKYLKYTFCGLIPD